jgi:hypothetical protein
MRRMICANRRLSQVAFGQLQDEVPGMSDQTAAGLEEPLLQARQRSRGENLCGGIL